MKKVTPIRTPKQRSPKASTKQAKPALIAGKETLAFTTRKVQKRAKPKAGKVTF
jgi:hypothetical protein